jgi:hypothetical protein
MRLSFLCAAHVPHHALRTEVPVHTELAKARPFTVILKLFKIAAHVVQYKDRVKLHLPSRCPVKHLPVDICGIILQTPGPVLNTT